MGEFPSHPRVVSKVCCGHFTPVNATQLATLRRTTTGNRGRTALSGKLQRS